MRAQRMIVETTQTPEPSSLHAMNTRSEVPHNEKGARNPWLLWGPLALVCLLVVGRTFEDLRRPSGPEPGTVAPVFQGSTIEGTPIGSETLEGQVVLLDFWASWCPPCVASLPGLEGLHQRFGTRGVLVLGVNEDDVGPEPIAAFLKMRQVTFPSIIDSGVIARQFGVRRFPTTYLLDGKGVVRAVYRGRVNPARVEQDILRLLSAS
jgi:cytochrome c biogenesis protein CcmG, thiol:disulfide interchange protein DsbE